MESILSFVKSANRNAEDGKHANNPLFGLDKVQLFFINFILLIVVGTLKSHYNFIAHRPSR